MNREKTTATLLIAIFILSIFAVGVQAMHFLGMNGSTVTVTSEHLCEPGAETKAAFDAEPEFLVLGDTVFDAQSDTVTIEGTISELVLGDGWPDTAYVEIGVRPVATKTQRNAGVYMIFFASGPHYVVHLQDYSAHGSSLGFTVAKDLAPFTYKITLTPTGSIGGTADLVLYDENDVEVGTNTGVEYGYASTWEEAVPGDKNEDFSEAYLFYSIIADRRGVAGEIYSATVGDITTNILLPHLEVWVDDDYTDVGYNDGHVWGIDAFAKIQDGVDVVDPEGTVYVAPGTYPENIVIGKSLTVKSIDGAEVTTIDAQLAEFGVLINGAETIATFEGFTVENYDTVGILGGAFSTVLEGVELGDDPVEVHILNNIVMPPTIEPPHNNNIQIGDGTTGTVIGNEVSGAFLESGDWSGSGILVAGSSNVVVSDNHVYDCEGGIQIVGYIYKNPAAPAVDNIIESNLVENCDAGISVQGDSIGTIIRYNDVLNNDVGIGSLAYDYPWQQATPSDTEIHYNNIVGNENYGVKSSVWFWQGTGDVLAEDVDATLNWWGHNSGPYHSTSWTYMGLPYGPNLLGLGDEVSDHVLYDPWIVEATVDIRPESLNTRSRGYMTIYIELPENCDVGDIDIYSIVLTAEDVELEIVDGAPTAIGDCDEDGIPDLMVKFDRSELIESLGELTDMFSEATLEVTGKLADGTLFEGTDTIRVLKR